MQKRHQIKARGVVQGVGFRPFIYRLAQELGLAGFVRNTTEGADIEVEGRASALKTFTRRLQDCKPRAASIDFLDIIEIPPTGAKQFVIQKSAKRRGFTHIAPDIATCEKCYQELYDSADRRYRYPFVNCTNCGPRYSIIKNTPYDRARTTMVEFAMCHECSKEFKTVLDRRFHAQPDCCSRCGPRYKLYKINGSMVKTEDAILTTAQLLQKGKIIAIKGIGGYHIACDATNSIAVERLRSLKHRPTKPFAIMIDPRNLYKIAYFSDDEAEFLRSPIAPIVLLCKKKSVVSESVAPQNPYLGVVLPYAPVHFLLLEINPYLVMTSGNVQDEPIVKDEKEVKRKLKRIVNYFLDHNRPIENRCDDSVGFFLPKRGFSIIRRSRGYVPRPIQLPEPVPATLAVGPYLKNTFVLARGREAYMSPHIGDLANLETMEFFKEMIAKYKLWFRIEPEFVVHDLHPDYLSTKLAQDSGLPANAVQHHIAHIVSCLGEHNMSDKAIGIVFDGTGYGIDGRIWGGEFFVGDIRRQNRVAHLEYLPLPGGESSILKPYRIAIAYIEQLCHRKFKPKGISTREVQAVAKLLKDQRFTVETSSMGRLFDCIAGMIGLVKEITYEAEAAINLEYIAARNVTRVYPYTIEESDPMQIRVEPIIQGVLHDLRKGVSFATISAKFHNTVVQFSLDIVDKLSILYKISKVCLSGGVFQNRYLLAKLVQSLERAGYSVYIHHKLPTNDGCISYGQVIYAANRVRNKGEQSL